ncbi:hypothetical protein O3P69_014665 [Scylla paramamosain]|uniref:Secreted protein n=1 Tax=Scylla paramamosain TaxID=85552 RepID=A0AAW0TXK0_SCYPA
MAATWCSVTHVLRAASVWSVFSPPSLSLPPARYFSTSFSSSSFCSSFSLGDFCSHNSSDVVITANGAAPPCDVTPTLANGRGGGGYIVETSTRFRPFRRNHSTLACCREPRPQ